MVIETLLTPEVKAKIGAEAQPLTAPDEVCRSEIRRFVQATMDDNPLWYDEEYARATRFGVGCGPGAYTLRAPGHYRRPLGTPDPIRNATVDDDPRGAAPEEAPLRVPFPKGIGGFHGGDDVEFFQLPRLGDVITVRARIADIIEKTGRSGKLGLVITERTYTNQRGEVLCINRNTAIYREMKGKAWE